MLLPEPVDFLLPEPVEGNVKFIPSALFIKTYSFFNKRIRKFVDILIF